jgi:nucleotide-binding universal stress UspA family protein
MKSILLGLDDSEYTASAIELAIQWGRQFDCLVVGLGVIDEPKLRGEHHVEGGRVDAVFDQLVSSARRRVEGLLESFTLRCSEAQVSHKLLEDVGSPAERILLEAQRYDLVMLGQQTYFHFQTQSRPCKTLENVLRVAPRPVVAVPKTIQEGSGILIAYDGSLQSVRTLYTFVTTGLQTVGDVTVLNVHTGSHVESAKTTDRAVEFLGFHGVRAKAQQIASTESPGKVILDEVARQDAGLLVMGAYGQPRITEFLVGSTTRTALDECPVPVLLYH